MTDLKDLFPLEPPRRIVALGLGPQLNAIRTSTAVDGTFHRTIVPYEVAALGAENVLTWLDRHIGRFDALALPLFEHLKGERKIQQARAIQAFEMVADNRHRQVRVWPILNCRPRVWPMAVLGGQPLTPLDAAAVLTGHTTDGAYLAGAAAALLEVSAPARRTANV